MKLGKDCLIINLYSNTKTSCRKSKLRKREEIALGPKYAGTRVSRKALEDTRYGATSLGYEDAQESTEANSSEDPETIHIDMDEEDGDIDSDAAFGESDEEKFKDFTFRGSKTALGTNGKTGRRKTAADFMSDSNDENTSQRLSGNESTEDDGEQLDGTPEASNDETDEESLDYISNAKENAASDSDIDENDEGSVSDGSEVVGDDEKSRRAELRRIMNEDQKVVAATISQAARADAEKGIAVKQQRKILDSLLNVRIRLQKALIATNSMVAAKEKIDDIEIPYRAAEEAAIKLLGTLDALRQKLNDVGVTVRSGGKRKRTLDLDTPSSEIWESIQDLESTVVGTRRSTLEKWSSRVRDTTSLPLSDKLNTITKQTITDVLQDQLSNSERLIKRTKMPRSCAPVQVQMKITEDPHIFDDADFYQLLLKELVDQRMMDSNTLAPLGDGDRPMAQWTTVKEAKTKKRVDTKASKGRKIRYTIHEKLQNFMAPEDRGTWEQDAVDRFFGTLLGQKMNLREEDDDGNVSDEGEGAPLAEEALMLFRS